MQTIAGNATWVSEFSPFVKGPEKYVAEILLWLFYRLGLCSGIVGQFAMYIRGKVTSHTNLITIYTAYDPKNAVLQNCRFIANYPYTRLLD